MWKMATEIIKSYEVRMKKPVKMMKTPGAPGTTLRKMTENEPMVMRMGLPHTILAFSLLPNPLGFHLILSLLSYTQQPPKHTTMPSTPHYVSSQ